MAIEFDSKFSKRALGMKASEIRELLKLTQKPGIISFAGGLPDPTKFPYAQMQEIANSIIEYHGKFAFQYSATEGITRLRENIVKLMVNQNPKLDFLDVNNIQITNGSQQGLDLLAMVLLDEGNDIILGSPTYLGALQAFNAYMPNYVTIPLDKEGMQIDRVEEYLDGASRMPKMIYTVPTFHNPAGVCMSNERRKKLAAMAIDRNLLVVEDDPYGMLRYEGERQDEIMTYAPDNVVNLRTFSKTMTPGLRVAWMAGPEELIYKIGIAKQGTDLCSSAFVQYMASEYIERGYIYTHVEKVREIYGQKKEIMVNAMKKYFPPEADYAIPKGGMFLWVTLPEYISTREMFSKAIEKEVAYVIGETFFADGGGKNTMRLNFSHEPPEIIEEGIKRLANVIKEEIRLKRDGGGAQE
jgi:2-aminoadipate transaminase